MHDQMVQSTGWFNHMVQDHFSMVYCHTISGSVLRPQYLRAEEELGEVEEGMQHRSRTEDHQPRQILFVPIKKTNTQLTAPYKHTQEDYYKAIFPAKPYKPLLHPTAAVALTEIHEKISTTGSLVEGVVASLL